MRLGEGLGEVDVLSNVKCLQHKEFVLMTPTYGIVCLDAYDLICVG
jgi:hypothetical protein